MNIVGKSIALLAISGAAVAIAAKIIPGIGDAVFSIEQAYFKTEEEKIGFAILGAGLLLTMGIASALLRCCRGKKEDKGMHQPLLPAIGDKKAQIVEGRLISGSVEHQLRVEDGQIKTPIWLKTDEGLQSISSEDLAEDLHIPVYALVTESQKN